ncbi:MAG: ATP-binding protein [Pseudobdellovibrionaceae bacterium]
MGLQKNEAFILRNSRSSILTALACGVLGYTVNQYSVDIGYDISFSFGGILVFFCALLAGPWWGFLAGVITASATLSLYHHPYAMIIWAIEAFTVTYFYKSSRIRALIVADLLFWLIIGTPLIFITYWGVMSHTPLETFTISLKQGINGMMNVFVAEISFLLFSSLYPKFIKGRSQIPLSELLFHMAVGLLFIPVIFFVFWEAQSEVKRNKYKIDTELKTSLDSQVYSINEWLTRQIHSLKELNKVAEANLEKPSTNLQRQLMFIKNLSVDLHNVYLANETGTTYAFYPPVNDRGENTIGLNFSHRKYFEKMQAGESLYISNVFQGSGGIFEPIVTLTTPTIKNGKFSGYALVAINLQSILKFIDNQNTAGKYYSTLLDSENQIVVSNFPGRKALSKFNLSPETITLEKGISARIRIPEELNSQSGLSKWKKSYYYNEASLVNGRWKLIVEYPISELQALSLSRIRIILLRTFALILVSILVSYFLSRKVSDVIKELALIAQSPTDQQNRWPRSRILEVDQLAKSLRRYSNRIHSVISEVQNLNHNLEVKVQERTSELSVSEARYRTLVENNRAPMMEIHFQTGRISYANESCCRLYGWSKEELTTMSLTAITTTPIENIELAFNKIDSDEVKFFQTQHRTKSGELIDVEIYPNIFHVAGEKVIFSIIVDVSQRLRAEKMVEAQRAKLVSKDRMALLGQMAGGLAHEINNPIAVIGGNSELLMMAAQSQKLDTDKVIAMAQKINLMVERIAKIINGLRTFSKDTENEQMVEISAQELVEKTLQLCQKTLNKQNIEISLDLDSSFFVKCHPSQISQVLLNLFLNAADAVEKLNEKWIKVKIAPSKEKILFSVLDSGHGIPPDIASKIMNPFFTTKIVGKGVGLGLSISSGIIENHGGELHYELREGHTCFFFELPGYIKKIDSVI